MPLDEVSSVICRRAKGGEGCRRGCNHPGGRPMLLTVRRAKEKRKTGRILFCFDGDDDDDDDGDDGDFLLCVRRGDGCLRHAF